MNRWLWLVVSCCIIALDQGTKTLALTHLIPYQSVPVMPLLNWTLAYNTGAAFSFLNDAGGWQQWFFAGFSMVMSLIIGLWLFRLPEGKKSTSCALSLILGGALGNLIDRLHYGHVIDFIDVHYQNYHWPVFNVADSAICIGAVILIAVTLRESRDV